MNKVDRVTFDRVRALDPAKEQSSGSVQLDERARRDLDVILNTPQQPTRHTQRAVDDSRAPWYSRAAQPPRRVVVAVAVTALVLGAAGIAGLILLGSGERAYAATPAALHYTTVPGASASTMLRGIADRTEQRHDPVGQGNYTMVEIQSWDLFTRVDGQQASSTVIPQVTRTWRAIDGSGRVETIALTPEGRQHTLQTYQPGQLATMWAPGSLSDNPSVLARQLTQGHPTQNGPAERLVAVADAYRAMPLTSPVRAAMLRYLAATPGIAPTGHTTDRAGRQGIAFSVQSDLSGLPTRYTMVIDPATGSLLDSEQTLTTTAGKLNVAVPSVISYTLYLRSTYTNTDGSR